MTQSASPSSTLGTALRRFWWVVVILTALTAVAAAGSAQFAPGARYASEGQLIVPVRVEVPETILPPPISTLPANPFDAQGLARTYAVILEADRAVLQSVSRDTGIPLDEIEEELTVEQVNSTSVLAVGFTSENEAGVRAFFPSLVAALGAGVSPNIPAGNLVALQEARVTTQSGLPVSNTVIGVVAGLLLGLAVALLLERLDARVRASTDLRRLTDLPVVDLTGDHGLTGDGVLATRALRLAPHVRHVAVVGVDSASAQATPALADRLSIANQQLPAAAADGRPVPRAGWTGLGVLDDGNPAELGVQQAEATVLVLTVGSRMRAVENALTRLRLLDVSSVVVAVLPRARRRFWGSGPADAAPVTPVAPEAAGEARAAGADDQGTGTQRDLAGRP